MFWNKKVKVDETPKYRHWITIKHRGGEINLETVGKDEVATWEPFKEFYNWYLYQTTPVYELHYRHGSFLINRKSIDFVQVTRSEKN
jgi:hypothetical protein